MKQKGFATAILMAIIVILLGALVYVTFIKKSEPPVIEKTFIDTVPAPTPKDDTANWKTYTDNQYGFEFKYPENMSIRVSTVSGPGNDVKQFYINELDNARLVEVSLSSMKNNTEFISFLQNLQGNKFTNVEKDFFNLGKAVFHSNNDGVKSLCGDGSYEAIIYNGYKFTFMDYSSCSNGLQISAILNTFKFITPSSDSAISDWKTYTNSQYGFEVAYPKEYLESNKGGNTVASFRSPGCKSLVNGGGEWPAACQAYQIDVQQNKITAEGSGISKTTVSVAGITAEKITTYGGMWDNMAQVVVQFQKGQNWYIQTFTFNQNQAQTSESVINHTLSTFIFAPAK